MEFHVKLCIYPLRNGDVISRQQQTYKLLRLIFRIDKISSREYFSFGFPPVILLISAKLILSVGDIKILDYSVCALPQVNHNVLMLLTGENKYILHAIKLANALLG